MADESTASKAARRDLLWILVLLSLLTITALWEESRIQRHSNELHDEWTRYGDAWVPPSSKLLPRKPPHLPVQLDTDGAPR